MLLHESLLFHRVNRTLRLTHEGEQLYRTVDEDPIDIGDAVHIWTSRRLPGVVIPATAIQYEREPG